MTQLILPAQVIFLVISFGIMVFSLVVLFSSLSLFSFFRDLNHLLKLFGLKTKDIQGDMMETLKRQSQLYEKTMETAFSKMLNEFKEESLKLYERERLKIEAHLNSSLAVEKSQYKKFYETLSSNNLKLSNYYSDATKKQFEEVMSQIESYKAQRIATIDKLVEKKAEELAKEALKKSISIEVQEDIVLKLVENAKKKGIII